MNAAPLISRARLAYIASHIAQLRLSADDIDDLRYYWTEYEADIGVRSLHVAQCAVMLGVSSAGSWSEPEVERRACLARARGSRVARVLRAMVDGGERDAVAVLYRIYGPKPPNLRWDTFGEYAPLAEYTPTVLALAERMTREHRASVLESTMAKLSTAAPGTRERVGASIRELVSTGDVLRAKLDRRPQRQAGASDEVFARARKDAEDVRRAFVQTVKKDADQLLVRASNAYRTAKERRR